MSAILVLSYCSYLVSGPVWNHMKRPPLFGKTANGRKYVDTVWRSQYLAESYVVAIACILFESFIISLPKMSSTFPCRYRLNLTYFDHLPQL